MKDKKSHEFNHYAASWVHKADVEPEYWRGDVTMRNWVMVLLILLAFMFGGVWGWLVPRATPDPLDLNHDGKITLTDKVMAHKLELQIDERLVGELAPTLHVEASVTNEVAK